MFYETEKNDHGLPHNPFKAIVAPRPIGWISTLDKDGKAIGLKIAGCGRQVKQVANRGNLFALLRSKQGLKYAAQEMRTLVHSGVWIQECH